MTNLGCAVIRDPAAGRFSEEQADSTKSLPGPLSGSLGIIIRALSRECLSLAYTASPWSPRFLIVRTACFAVRESGSRQGKRLLVWHSGIDDPMTSGHYTLKVYSSEKQDTSDGSWQHRKIVLKPLNADFEPIVLTSKDEGDVRVIAELHAVLSSVGGR